MLDQINSVYIPKIDLTNTETEYFKIIDYAGRIKSGKLYRYKWNCICKLCNKNCVIRGDYLRLNKTKSCGCIILKSGTNHKDWDGYGELYLDQYSSIKRSAEIRGIQFEVTIDFLWNLYLKQNKLCALTGLPITLLQSKRNRGTASVDRIDSNQPYTATNIRWVHKDINIMKNVLSDEQLYFYAQKIIENKENNAR